MNKDEPSSDSSQKQKYMNRDALILWHEYLGRGEKKEKCAERERTIKMNTQFIINGKPIQDLQDNSGSNRKVEVEVTSKQVHPIFHKC